LPDVTVPEFEALISYALHQLAVRNAHHKFEEIATRIARSRLSMNIHVANGPVSSGGDQGRDAESYATRIPDELPNAAGFAASASTAPIVIACTLQKNGLATKIRKDLENICSADAAPVSTVAFFSVENVPEALTHKLQKEARENYDVRLEVFSGAKIAAFIAEPDLAWIARTYLHLPESQFPRTSDEDNLPDWYVDLRDAWRSHKGTLAVTSATQSEVARGMRHATFDPQARADLTDWVDHMRAFLVEDAPKELQFTARYEIAVARFRGLGTGEGSNHLIPEALQFACTSPDLDILDSAVTLAVYWGNMWSAGLASVTAATIATYRDALREHLVTELRRTDRSEFPVRAASLLGALARSYLQPKWETAEARGLVPTNDADHPPVGEHLPDMTVDADIAERTEAFELDVAMQWLEQLVEVLPSARAYSVSSLSRLFDMFAPAFARFESYKRVRNGLDEAVARVHSDGAMGHKLRDRGVNLLENEMPLEGLVELHEAKLRWFHGDLMYGSVLALRLIAQTYAQLGLHLAAKMYALDAVALAGLNRYDNTKEQIASAVLEAASYSLTSGCQLDASALTNLALAAHGQFDSDAFNFERHPHFQRHAVNSALQLAVIRQLWPEMEPSLRATHTASDWFDYIASLAEEGAAGFSITEEEFSAKAHAQLGGAPFSDLGPERTVDFSALGVRWSFRFENTRTAVVAAEGFIAALQVLLADLARFHPVVVSAQVSVLVQVSDDVDEGDAVFSISPDLSDGLLYLSPSFGGDPDSSAKGNLATGLEILAAVHARPLEDLQQLVTTALDEGLMSKLFVARPYVEVADLLPDDHFSTCASLTRPASSNEWAPTASLPLRASTKTGPSYDKPESLERIAIRYEKATDWRFTFAKALANPAVTEVISTARADGWLDWQIASAIMNVAINARLDHRTAKSASMMSKAAREALLRPEVTPEEAISPSRIAEELPIHLMMQTLTVAQGWQLLGPAESPGEGIMRELLVRRYHFEDDDVEHVDLLAALSDDGAFRSLIHPT
jgi:hypothetical protein